ncbi:phosphoglycerate mutase-like protein [Rhizoclosmatium globosum]|uniref:Phosphoglycerate mutase-like protein n=1 Tax=Rhizoclosmatium globosum TaxID=329046 RepID=A0A1Y2CFW9_9FUNG|nr:phosphoglycerate mutase-like protein [Rhizoclosmatium globosum]|eukprot:ORY45953.1 phosphoglycerate mutase-like protein [Rhizoclosmatium globosum]
MARPPRAIYILRHGIRQDFISTTFISPTSRTQDPPLSASGHAQAASLARFLGGLPASASIKHIFCSPFSRCIQTVHPTALALGLPINIEPGVGEWFKLIAGEQGDAESEAPSAKEVAAALDVGEGTAAGQIDTTYAPVHPLRVPRENPAQIHARFNSVLKGLVQRLDDAGVEGDVLVCTHAAGVITAVRGLLEWVHAPVVAGVCTYVKLVRDGGDVAEGQREWKCEVNGECTHLSEHGGLMYNWQFPGAFAPVGAYVDIFNPPPIEVGKL